MASKGKQVPKLRGPRPHTWMSGPDEYRHSMYIPWLRQKAQAKHRGEEWDLSFEDFYRLWQDDFHNRGRLATNMVMTRDDTEGVWDRKNTILMTRRDHLVRHGMRRKGEKRRPYRRNK
jgi:hypothetical protein